MQNEEKLLNELQYLANRKYIETQEFHDVIYFSDVEDMITFIIKYVNTFYKVQRCKVPEGYGNRIYYIIECKFKDKKVTLISDSATDYSGHGNHDYKLMEYFLKLLGVPIQDISPCRLINMLLNKMLEHSEEVTSVMR